MKRIRWDNFLGYNYDDEKSYGCVRPNVTTERLTRSTNDNIIGWVMASAIEDKSNGKNQHAEIDRVNDNCHRGSSPSCYTLLSAQFRFTGVRPHFSNVVATDSSRLVTERADGITLVP